MSEGPKAPTMLTVESVRSRWKQGADGSFRPTPPYRKGEVVACEGCGRPVRVNDIGERYQFMYGECRSCNDDYDGYMARMEAGDD